MNTEKLQKWALVAEIIGGAAVIVSLVFVGLEIRDSNQQTELNTQAVRMAAYQELNARISEVNRIFMEAPSEIYESFRRGFNGSPDMNPVDENRFNSFMFYIMRQADMAYYHYELGAINEERLKSSISALVNRLDSARAVERWQEVKSNFVPAFQQYIDQIIEEK